MQVRICGYNGLTLPGIIFRQCFLLPSKSPILTHQKNGGNSMKTLFPKAHLGLQTLFDDKFTHHKFPLDCKQLPAFGQYDRKTRTSGYLGKLFTKLDEIKTPVIYWFEAKDGKEAERQFKLITAFGKKQKRASQKTRRVVPLPNGNGTTGSKVLYVGKRHGGCRKDGFTHIADRMEMHLGYNPTGKNQGVQLVHWNDGQFTLNILELPSGAGPYLAALEQLFAIEFTPLLGRH